MESSKEKKTFFCAKYQKQYDKRQNLEQRYSTEIVRAGQKYEPNICFNDSGPRVWDHDLEKAVKNTKNS